MDKQEFEAQKADIIARLGKPERDFDRAPLNESARLIDELIKARREEGRKASLNVFVKDEIPKPELKQAFKTQLPPIEIEEHDLKGFSDIEKAVIVLHYQDDSLNNQELARRCNTKHQTVTALFHSAQFQALDVKYFNLIADRKTRRAILYLLQDNNAKMTERMGENLGIIKPERQDLNITSKPIEDPDAMKLLRELGDKLSE